MKRILVLISVLVILVTSLSCLPAAPKTSQKDIDQDTVISDLKTSVSSMKESIATIKDSVKVASDKITTLENKPAPTATTPTNMYTKTEVDAAIAQAVTNAVNNLKNDQTWIKSTSTSSSHTSSSSSSDDDVIASSGDLELIELTHLGDEVYFGNNSSQTWKLVVRNNDTARHYFKLTLDMTTEDGSTVSFSEPPSVTSNYPTSGTFITSTTSFTNISDLGYILYNGSSTSTGYKIYIGKDTEQTLYITVLMKYSTISGKLWDCEFGIKSYDD